MSSDHGVPIPDRSVRIYRCALCFAAAFSVLHAVSLPVLVTWDGHLYADLADVLLSARFPRDWDFLRTPLYPFFLKLAFWLLGRQPLAVIAVGTTLGFTGVWALAAAIRRVGHPRAAAAAALLLALHPTLVIYEHCLLTETGTFCFLALIVNALLWSPPPRFRGWDSALLALLVTVGYYFRPSILYLAPPLAVFHLAAVVRRQSEERSPQEVFRGTWRRATLRVAGIALVPFLLAWPWNRLLGHTRAADVWLLGVVKQALIPPDDPALGSAALMYKEGIARSSVSGHLGVAGILAEHQMRIQGELSSKYQEHASALFARMAMAHPGRYLAGVGRTMLLFAGFPSLENENQLYRTAILGNPGSTIYPGPPNPGLVAAIQRDFAQRTGISAVASFLKVIAPVYDVLVLLAACLTAAAFVFAVLRLDPVLLAFSGVPVAFTMLHAATLLALDRYSFPMHPILLAGLVLAPLRFRRKREVGHEPASVRSANVDDRRWLLALATFIGVLAACHIAYLAFTRMVPSWDEAHYISGAIGIVRGLKSGTLAGAWNGFAGALAFKPPLLSVLAAFLSLVLGEGTLAPMLSLVLIFVGMAFAAWSLFRNLLPPSFAAAATALLCMSPMVTGLTHRFYVENLFLVIAMLYLDVLVRSGWSSLSSSVFAGVLLGLGLLTKSTFVATVFLSSCYILYEAAREVLKGAERRRRLVALAGRVFLMLLIAFALAWTWYSRNWRAVIAHARAAFSATDCWYPTVGAFLADISSGPFLPVFVLSVLGLFALLPRLSSGTLPTSARRAWIAILLLGLTTFLATTISVNKATRLSEGWLPAMAALAAFAFSIWSPRISRLGAVVVIAVSFVLFLHNSFGVLQGCHLRFGDLIVVDDRYPLNIPDWFNDNHPVDRRPYRLQEITDVIATDAASNLGPMSPVDVRLTTDALLLNHDEMSLFASLRNQRVSYFPWYWPGPPITSSGGPAYVVHGKNFGSLSPGTHGAIDYMPQFDAEVAAGHLPYEEIARIPEPGTAEVFIFRKRNLAGDKAAERLH